MTDHMAPDVGVADYRERPQDASLEDVIWHTRSARRSLQQVGYLSEVVEALYHAQYSATRATTDIDNQVTHRVRVMEYLTEAIRRVTHYAKLPLRPSPRTEACTQGLTHLRTALHIIQTLGHPKG